MAPDPDDLDELIRADAYARLPALPAEERKAWRKRRASLSRALGVSVPAPPDGVSALVWRLTLESVALLRSAFQDVPERLRSRYALDERRRLETYAEAHVAVLFALRRRPG